MHYPADRRRIFLPLCLLALVACGETNEADSGSSSETAGEASSGSGEASSGSGEAGTTSTDGSTTTTDSTSGTTDSTSGTTDSSGSGSFVNVDMSSEAMCSPTLQDCGEGEKCVAYSTEGDSPPAAPWDANKCVDETGQLEPGDSCDIVGGKYTGEDDCRAGAQCLLTDDDGLGGACVEFCDDQMGCSSANAICSVYNNGSLPLCLDRCDPLVQDCPDGQGCFQGPAQDFICFKVSADPGEGGPGQDCAFVNQCQAGNLCLAPDAVQGCDPGNSGCCSPICEISGGGSECGNMESCTPVFDPPVPPGYADVGVCSLPTG